MKRARHEYRRCPYRPPRRERDRIKQGGFRLYRRFFVTYLWPHRMTLAACIAAVCLHACTPYILTYYNRLVVDYILEIQPEATEPEASPERPGSGGRGRTLTSGPRTPGAGLGRRLEPGRAMQHRAPDAGHRLWLLFLIYCGTLVFLDVITRAAQQARIRIARSMVGRLRNDLHRKVLELSLTYQRLYTPGRLLARIVSDIEVIQQQMMNSVFMAARCSCMILVGLGILFAVEWRLGLVASVTLPVYAALFYRIRPRLRSINRELRHTNSCLYGLASQKIDTMRAIQAYARERFELLTFHRMAACFLRDAVAQNRLAGKMVRAAEIVGSLGTSAVLLLGAWWVLGGRMTLGVMLFIYGTTAALFAPVVQLTRLNVIFNNLFVVLQRVVDVLDERPVIVDPPDAKPFPAPLRRGIDLRGICFQYGMDGAPILDALDLTIPAGQWMCIMGPSGSGKTSLLHLLCRLYEPENGRILFDGLPLDRIAAASFRNGVGLVPQEAQIFSGSIRDNICYGRPDAEPSDIMAAARAAELHDFIMTLPVKYETLLGEKGVSLSGGQRQRLSLARALLSNPEVLLLDDCTSALDAQTERRIQDTLSHVLAGKTAVIVSQRVSMARRCHRICVLDQGRIAEIGTHEELLAGEGFYARLHRQQTG